MEHGVRAYLTSKEPQHSRKASERERGGGDRKMTETESMTRGLGENECAMCVCAKWWKWHVSICIKSFYCILEYNAQTMCAARIKPTHTHAYSYIRHDTRPDHPSYLVSTIWIPYRARDVSVMGALRCSPASCPCVCVFVCMCEYVRVRECSTIIIIYEYRIRTSYTEFACNITQTIEHQSICIGQSNECHTHTHYTLRLSIAIWIWFLFWIFQNEDGFFFLRFSSEFIRVGDAPVRGNDCSACTKSDAIQSRNECRWCCEKIYRQSIETEIQFERIFERKITRAEHPANIRYVQLVLGIRLLLIMSSATKPRMMHFGVTRCRIRL